jgi:hypothetical protein
VTWRAGASLVLVDDASVIPATDTPPARVRVVSDARRAYALEAAQFDDAASRQFGKSRVTQFRRACCKPLREATHPFAFCSLNWNARARAYYDATRQQGKKHAEALRYPAPI